MSNVFNKPQSTNFQGNTQSKLREFNVGIPQNDAFDPHAPEMFEEQPPLVRKELTAAEREELQKLRREQINNAAKITDHAKKRTELLANIGRLTKDVEIEGYIFSLRTLKTKEAREATLSIFNCANDAEAAFELRKQSLARSLYQINGQPLDLILGGVGLEHRLNFIEEELEDTIMNKLYNEFLNLRQESRDKYGVQTEEEVKEVMEDLKK